MKKYNKFEDFNLDNTLLQDNNYNSIREKTNKSQLEEFLQDIKIENIQTSQTSLKELDLSDLIIGHLNIIQEKWDYIENIDSQILEISDEYVILNCLIDKEKRIYQQRSFKKIFLNNINLEINQLVIIRIFGRAGEIRYKFEDGNNIIPSEYFDFPDDFEDFDDISFGKSL
jgi:hypothetical protein